MPVKEYYQRHKTSLRQYNKSFLSNWRRNNPEKVEQHNKSVWSNMTAAQKAKKKARQQTQYLIETGKLNREFCQFSGCFVMAEAHHDDYSKIEDIKWFCKSHHEEYHHGK